ncbi:MAG TPA: MFS transporter [Steroidobacteraceae bacterium]|nr:MFS transporter [Steroidobacteraceae bacterium]
MATLDESIPLPAAIGMSADDSGRMARRFKLSLGSKWIYGSGEMVNGITATGLTYLAFFYLTAVCGLSGTRAGMITFIALLVDSVADPLVGLASDNTRSRLGRRHPYLFGSIVPIALSFALVFSIPASVTGIRLFCYVVLLMLILRVGLSFFYLPYLAIGAEISDDYHERSSIVGFRLCCSAVGAFACLYLGLGGLSANPAALLQRSNYLRFGWVMAAALIVIGLGAAFGTLRQIPRLHQAHRRSGTPLLQLIRELREIFHNRSFVSLFLCCLVFFVAQGTAAVLALDANRYFWNLSAGVNQAVLLTLVLSPILGMPIARLLQNVAEKRTISIAGALVFAACQFYPPLLRIYGLLPNDFKYIGPLLVVNAAVSAVGLVVSSIAFQSMMADAADHHEYLFGVRREAMFLSGVTFSVKAASGLGSLIAGVALDAVHFPADIASLGLSPHLPIATVHGLGWISGPLPAVLTALCTLPLLIYSLDQEKYRAIKQALSERRKPMTAEGPRR